MHDQSNSHPSKGIMRTPTWLTTTPRNPTIMRLQRTSHLTTKSHDSLNKVTNSANSSDACSSDRTPINFAARVLANSAAVDKISASSSFNDGMSNDIFGALWKGVRGKKTNGQRQAYCILSRTSTMMLPCIWSPTTPFRKLLYIDWRRTTKSECGMFRRWFARLSLGTRIRGDSKRETAILPRLRYHVIRSILVRIQRR